MRPLPVIIATGLCGLIGGCGDPDRPPSIRFGEEACSHCRMIISDARFAAALVDDSGESLKFDDVGCLVDHEALKSSPASARLWVRDFERDGWLDARSALYAKSTDVSSPMGYGLRAASPTSPRTGPFFRFEELAAIVAKSSRQKDKTPILEQ